MTNEKLVSMKELRQRYNDAHKTKLNNQYFSTVARQNKIAGAFKVGEGNGRGTFWLITEDAANQVIRDFKPDLPGRKKKGE